MYLICIYFDEETDKRIRYLIERKNIKPAEILSISFTNDSVNDIKKSLLKYYNYR